MAAGKAKKINKHEIAEKIEEGWIRARAIVEMVGAPKDYISKTLKQYIDQISEKKQMVLLKKKYSTPKKQDKLFSLFADIEFLIKDASELAFFCFDYMPSSIEIVEPEKFYYNAIDFAAFFNDLQARLHKLDMVMKNLTARSQVLEKNAGLLLRNNILILLKHEDQGIETLSKGSGIPPDQLRSFLEKLIREGWIKEEKGKFKLLKTRLKRS